MSRNSSRYSFLGDYSEGCHPNILKALADSNMMQHKAYGQDDYSLSAAERIRTAINNPEAAVYFVTGGTQANIITTACGLRPHEAIIAAETGHIAIRETGAIEATGHKIVTVPTDGGKLTPQHIHDTITANSMPPHMPRLRLVYISNTTELGTVYNKAELTALAEACKLHNLWLLMDGARLGAALTAPHNDLSLADVAELTDIFWLGGTKSGALLGEAIIIPNPELATDFAFHLKQRGALLAKGRVLGIQFDELLKNDLMFELARHANVMAQKLATAIANAGHSFAIPSESNQIFPILPNSLIEELQEEFEFYVWEEHDEERSTIRLVTSWATDASQVDRLITKLR